MHNDKNKKMRRRKIREAISDIIIIVIIAVLIIFAINTCNGQNIGGNGAGFFENIDDATEQSIENMAQPFTLRVPGGAIAKFADPYTNPHGWGLTHEGVDSIQIKYGSDEEEKQADALSKWHGRVNEQPATSYLDALIDMQALFPDMTVIWTANVFIPAAHTTNAIEYLIAGGVHIVAIEMGNETYSQLNYNFDKYTALVTPLQNALKTAFPQIPISHIAAPIGKGRKEQDAWNSKLNAYRSAGDYITLHYYLGSKEIPAIGALTNRKGVDYNNPSPALSATFDSVATQLLGYSHAALNSAPFIFPGATLIITETNTQPSEPLGDTFLNAAYQFQFLIEHRDDFRYITWHNFVSPDVYGMFSRIKKGETGTPMKARTTACSFDLVGDIPTDALPISDTTITTAGEHWFYYINTSNYAYSLPVHIDGVALDSVRHRFFSAPSLSSNQITTGYSETLIAQPHACGWVMVKTSQVAITGCMDPAALNYNAEATIPGTCVYPYSDSCEQPKWCNKWTRAFRSTKQLKKCKC